MAITPWSWTTSNGTASAAQTRAAYDALTSNKNTSEFHRFVWNDLVNKVNEVLLSFNLSWVNSYLSLANTLMNMPYEDLTAARFNALRYNTRYNSWTWAYDNSKDWYTGRVDFRGVETVGENAADIVYGRYFLELAERLNVVIGIINGTTPTKDMDLTLISNLFHEVGLFSGASAAIEVAEAGNIIPTAVMQSENLPSLILHIPVPSPILYASLETDEIASRLAGYIFIGTSVKNSSLIRLPSQILALNLPLDLSLQSYINTLPNKSFKTTITGFTKTKGDINTAGAEILGGIFHINHHCIAESVSLPTKNPGWCHTGIKLDIQNTLIAEMTKEFMSAMAAKIIPSPTLLIRSPKAFDTDTSFSSSSYSHIESSIPVPVLTDNIIHSPEVLASIGTAQFQKGFLALEVLDAPSFSAKIELEHISERFAALLNMMLGSDGVLEKALPTSLSQKAYFTLGVLSEIVSAFAPVLEHTLETSLEVKPLLHCPKAAILNRYTGISLNFTGDASPSFAGVLNTAEVQNKVALLSSAFSRRASSAVARQGARLRAEGAADIPHSLLASADTLIPCSPEAFANLTAYYGVGEMITGASFYHTLNTKLSTVEQIISYDVCEKYHLSQNGNLDHVFFAELSAPLSVGMELTAECDTEGGGNWQYPAFTGGVLSFYQAYLTEQNGENIFLDPTVAKAEVFFSKDIFAEADMQYNIATAGENIHGVNVGGVLSLAYHRGWEYPEDMGGGELYITQSIDTSVKNQFILEVN